LEEDKMSHLEPTLINPTGLADPTDKGFSHLAIVPPGAKTVYISGQFGADVTGRIVSDDYAGQLRQSFRNLRIAIEAAGAVPQSVAKLTILIVNHSDDKLPPLREELKALFGAHRPTITLMPVPRLAQSSMLFEIEAVAIVP
jgi:enamine deaminase RidA (YjgF/YER057c/UK114 family)